MTNDEMEAEIESRVRSEVDRRFAWIGWALYAAALLLIFRQAFILAFIAPKFKEMFDEMDIGELPVPTSILMACSRHAVVVFLALIVLTTAFHFTKQFFAQIVLIVVLLVVFSLETQLLFMPLISLMNKLGGAH